MTSEILTRLWNNRKDCLEIICQESYESIIATLLSKTERIPHYYQDCFYCSEGIKFRISKLEGVINYAKIVPDIVECVKNKLTNDGFHVHISNPGKGLPEPQADRMYVSEPWLHVVIPWASSQASFIMDSRCSKCGEEIFIEDGPRKDDK